MSMKGRGLVIHEHVAQGTDAWLQLRCGILTASTMGRVISPALKVAKDDKVRSLVWELLSQRITQRVPGGYQSDEMLRGHEDEETARNLYGERFGKVRQVGLITNDKWGFTLGYSPDGLVDPLGAIEGKSRGDKFQVQTIAEHVVAETCPPDFVIQVQTGLLVSERKWMDFISFCAGLPMAVIRIWPDREMQAAILDAAAGFEKQLAEKWRDYRDADRHPGARLVPTEWVPPSDDDEVII